MSTISQVGTITGTIIPEGVIQGTIIPEGIIQGTVCKEIEKVDRQTKTVEINQNGTVEVLPDPNTLLEKVIVTTDVIGGDTQMFILVAEDGTEYPAVVVDEMTMFDATADDIRLGKTAATDSGITIGEKVIPGYLAHEGMKRIRPGQKLEISLGTLNQYDYTLLQCVICKLNTNLVDSVATEKVVLNDSVYDVLSIVPLYPVTKNHDAKTIDLGFVNDTNDSLVLKYFTYKEIY